MLQQPGELSGERLYQQYGHRPEQNLGNNTPKKQKKEVQFALA